MGGWILWNLESLIYSTEWSIPTPTYAALGGFDSEEACQRAKMLRLWDLIDTPISPWRISPTLECWPVGHDPNMAALARRQITR